MKISNPEYAEAALVLTRCGIVDEDLCTSFSAVMQLAGDVEYGSWLQDIKALSHDEIASQYGHDQMRVVLALAKHAPA